MKILGYEENPKKPKVESASTIEEKECKEPKNFPNTLKNILKG